MVFLNNAIPSMPLPSAPVRSSLAPATSPEQASDHHQGAGYYSSEQSDQDEDKNETAYETERNYAPITPSAVYNHGGAIMRNHMDIPEDVAAIDPAAPSQALRRRAMAYEKMMMFY